MIISHRMALDEAAGGYKFFDGKQEDCRKVVLRSHGTRASQRTIPDA